jgi:hypothetical protein
VGEACGTHESGEKSIQGFGGKARSKVTTRKREGLMGGRDHKGS